MKRRLDASVRFDAPEAVKQPNMSNQHDPLRAPTTDDLLDANVEARPGSDPRNRGYDALERYLHVPNHAMFLHTSEDGLVDGYIREHWAALDGLSGEACDIHVSLFQLNGGEDFYSQLQEIYCIAGLQSVKPIDLPALHFWSDASSCTISLGDFDTQEKLRDVLRSLYSVIHDARGPISEEHAKLLRAFAGDARIQRRTAGANGQAVQGSTAGGDIVQSTHIYFGAQPPKEMTMADPKVDGTNSGQNIEDVRAGKGITQASDAVADKQTIKRAETPGVIEQKKSAAAQMSFGKWSATGYGVIGLVIVLLGYFAYKYFGA